MNVAIIGSGIIGLSTASVLQKAGYDLTIYSKDEPAHTTSSKAAAVWFPYLARPVEDVNRWSRATYQHYLHAGQEPDSGIRMIDLKVLTKDLQVWWKAALPEDRIHPMSAGSLPAGFEYGYQLKVPLVETPIYLPYLAKQVLAKGARLVKGPVKKINDLLDQHDWVINCSGLGAKELVGDDSLYPIKGQLLKVENRADVQHVIADFAFDAQEQELAYAFPRSDYLVLGGTALKNDYDTEAKDDLAAGILKRCSRITGVDLRWEHIKQMDTGLRPGRKEIRLERDGRIIHNYGHGGAGYTVCQGCALDVLALVQAEEKQSGYFAR